MSEEKTYRISEINKAIKGVIENTFSYDVWLKGEISDFPKNPPAGHIFFKLEEKKKNKNETLSTIQSIIWRNQRPKIRRKLAASNVGQKLSAGMDGLEVRVQGRLQVYWPGGRYSFIVKDIDPDFTLGKLMKGREAIKAYLKDNNLIDKNKKENHLPLVPQKIALITQHDTEGYYDFIQELKNSELGFEVFFHPAAVQGQKVETTVLKALNYFRDRSDIEVVVITRGGGSRTDLSWFDNKKIAEAIANYPYPVLTGIGHKTDTTITDLVAYSAQQTPSSLGQFFVDRAQNFREKINNIQSEIYHNLQQEIRTNQQYLKNLRSNFLTSVKHTLKDNYQKLHHLSTYLKTEAQNSLQNNKEKIKNDTREISTQIKNIITKEKDQLKGIKEKINIAHPKNILNRGFSINKINGKVVKSVNDISKEKTLTTILQDGKIKSKIKNVITKKDNL